MGYSVWGRLSDFAFHGVNPWGAVMLLWQCPSSNCLCHDRPINRDEVLRRGI